MKGYSAVIPMWIVKFKVKGQKVRLRASDLDLEPVIHTLTVSGIKSFKVQQERMWENSPVIESEANDE